MSRACRETLSRPVDSAYSFPAEPPSSMTHSTDSFGVAVTARSEMVKTRIAVRRRPLNGGGAPTGQAHMLDRKSTYFLRFWWARVNVFRVASPDNCLARNRL
jgi:hypothetical protein